MDIQWCALAVWGLQIIATSNGSSILGTIIQTYFVIEAELAIWHSAKVAFHHHFADNMGGQDLTYNEDHTYKQ